MIMLRKKPRARGAVSKQQNRPKPSRTVQWNKIIPPVLILVVIVVCYGALRGVLILIDKPVTRVVVKGDFQYVDKRAIVREVQPYLNDGFVKLDIEGMRKNLVLRPWIYDVAINRQWPDEILLTVEEQNVIAQWGENGYLNHRGELFEPKKRVREDAGLPVLDGPSNSSKKVVRYFGELRQSLLEQGLSLEQLSLSERGWLATLDNGVEFMLGDGEVMEKMRRFLLAYQRGLAKDFATIKRIDMRYSNGFSVAWNNEIKQG